MPIGFHVPFSSPSSRCLCVHIDLCRQQKGKWSKGSFTEWDFYKPLGWRWHNRGWMCEDVVRRKANRDSKRSRCPCVATWNAPGKQRRLRLKSFLFSFDKTKCFRWLTWGKLLYTVTGIWIHLMFVLPFKSTTRLCLILRSILHTGQIWSFPLFVFLFSNLYHSNFHPNDSYWPPLWNQKLPLALFLKSCSFSLSFFLVVMQTVFFSGSLQYPENSALPLNRTIIYLCMYNENEFTLLISSWNKHSKRLH